MKKLTDSDVFSRPAQALIDRRVAELEAQLSSGGEPADGMYLTYLLSSELMSRAEVYISVTELLLGGVDTVTTRNLTHNPH